MDSSASNPAPVLQPDGRPSAALAEEVMILHPPSDFDRPSVDREGAALQIHRLLAQVARCRGALDVALGDRLAALAEGDRLLRLGFVSLGDYARERLQIPPRRAQALARLSRELGSRPRLDRAVRQGALSARRAEVVLPVAQGGDEARWVELALDKRVTVRALDELVRAARAASPAESEAGAGAEAGAKPEPEPEPFRTLKAELTASQRELLELSMEIAGQLLGPGATKWKRLEAMCEEFLSDAPIELDEPIEPGAEGAGQVDERASGRERAAPVEEILEQSNHFWELLDEYAPAEPVQARERVAETDPFELDRGLCELGRARLGWDELVGRLGLLMRSLGLWRVLGFASLGHYCREQLGMSSRALQQRAWLEERLYGLPELRHALRRGEVGYECARLIARVARGFDIDRWLEWAEGRPVLDVRQAVERYEREPGHLRDRAAPWVGDCRCEPEPPGRLVELLHPKRPQRRGQPTVAPQPACSANPSQVQMCAPSDACSANPSQVQMCAPGGEASLASPAAPALRAESKAEPPADERCSPRWGPPTCFEPRPDRPQGGQEMRFAVPESVLELVWTTVSVIRERTGRWLGVGDCLEVLAAHFVRVWLPNLDAKRRRSVSQRIATRDRGRCTVPGCSRQAEHAHHIRYRSQGGGDEHENLTSECAGHHLAAEHQGFIQVSGRAPDQLTWKLGLRSDEPPLLEYRAGRRA